jgi:Peptidase_C39 like family
MQPILLNVPYYSQIDNSTTFHGPGCRQCNLTSHAMALEYLTGRLKKNPIIPGLPEPESVYGQLLAPYGDTTDNDAHTRCIEAEFGLKTRFAMDLGRTDIESQLARGIPVPIGVEYKTSGHWILVIGMDDAGLIVHDPYGVRAGAADIYDTSVSGASDRYSWALLEQVLWCDGPGTGWGRVFSS